MYNFRAIKMYFSFFILQTQGQSKLVAKRKDEHQVSVLQVTNFYTT